MEPARNASSYSFLAVLIETLYDSVYVWAQPFRGLCTHLTHKPFVAGVRAVDTDRDAGDAPGGVRNRTRVHLRHAETAADDNERGRQSADPDVPELPGSSGGVRLRGPENVGHRIRGDGTHLQHQRRGLQSKTNGVRFTAYTHARAFLGRPGTLFTPRAEPSGLGGLAAARGLLASLSQSAATPASRLRTPPTPAFALAHVALASPAVGGWEGAHPG
jgi:hypothetical protein